MTLCNKVAKTMFRFIFLGLTSLGVSSCDLTNSVTIVEEYPLCIPSQQLVAVDWDENKKAKEVTFYYDMKSVIPKFKELVYVDATANNKLISSSFFRNLQAQINAVKKDDLNESYGLRRLDSDDAVGVYHLFDDEMDLSLDAYIGSCYTLSESKGECKIEMDTNQHHLKVDFDLANLKHWKEIKEHVPVYMKGLHCN